MTRFVPPKSLLVLGLLASVLGFTLAFAASAIHPASAPHRTTAAAASGTARHQAATPAHGTNAAIPALLTAATTSAATHPAAPASTTKASYPQQFITTALLVPSSTAPAGSTPAGTDPAGANPNLEPDGGVCSVPGIGDIGSLLGLCQNGQSGLLGDLNNICEPSVPEPETANGGIDSIVKPPASSGPTGKTLYDNYGVSGQNWAAYGLQCSDMTSLIGNNVAGMVFDAAKAVDRVTITVYQSAAGNGILGWLANVVNRLITSLGNAIYFPYLAPVVLLGVMWLAWHGLIRKRATRTIEGTIWMVIACAAAIWLIGRPADFTGFGQSLSNGVTQVLNVAFSKLPNPGGANCVPVQKGDPQSPGGGNYGFTQGNGMVDQNADELWSVLVCKPWLDGEFGTTVYSTTKKDQTAVNKYGRQLLWSQAIAANENPTSSLISAKQATYIGIANALKAHDPSIYPLFQGNQWTSRMEIGFAALFAALVAGVLVLLIAITLIILKLGFLLLLIAGPFFLIVGTHPGFGRVVAVRWVEMIIGVLLKQVAVALVLSVLLYAYSLIMGTTDAVLPWALKILMIALVTVAVFIYRKPFQHLFSAVGYGSVGARERAEMEMYRSREVARRNTALGAAAVTSGFAGYRVGRFSRRDPANSAVLAENIAAAGGSTAAAAASVGVGVRQNSAGGPEVSSATDGEGEGTGGRPTAGAGRAWGSTGVDASTRSAPPLHLPPRGARGDTSSAPSGWARGGTNGTTAGGGASGRAGAAPPRSATPRVTRSSSAPAPPARSGAASASSGGAPARPSAAAPRSSAAPAAGPPPRTSGSSGGSRSRWRGEAPARQAPPPSSGSGRPLWRPGPVRSSSGWSGGSGGGNAAASPVPRPSGPMPRPAGPLPRPSGPPPASPAARPAAYPHTGGATQSQTSRGVTPAHGGGSRGSSNGGSSTNGGSTANGGSGGAPAAAPFWLRPVRRRK